MTERKITKSDCKYYRESDGSCLNFTYVGEYDPCTDGDLEHCYEKFPHFFNKKLQEMTENKRFEIKPSAIYNNRYVIHDSKKEYTFPVLDSTLNYMFCKALNELAEENKELQFRVNLLQEEVNEFYRGARENTNMVGQLKRENKELKLQLDAFKDKLCELGVSDVKLYGKRYYTELEEWLE